MHCHPHNEYSVVCIQDLFIHHHVVYNSDNSIDSIPWNEDIKEENEQMIITITGTPGTGKTYIAKKLAGENFRYVDLNAMIKKEKLYDTYDRKAKTFDVDIKKIKKLDILFKNYKEKILKTKKTLKMTAVKKMLKKHDGIIIDSHLSQYLDSDLCIVVKSDIKNIRKRLEKRGYPKKKIEDNVQSEIFDICLEEAKKEGRNILIMEN